MGLAINVYCDESCHLENDRQKAMVLGAVWCPEDRRREIAERIREIKVRHKLEAGFEAKWTKVGAAKLAFYRDLVDFFFDDDDLHFRGLVVPNKDSLDHEKHSQDHDTWYYKMYFTLLKVCLDPHKTYKIYIDIKDTRGAEKVEKLHDVLCMNAYDFSRKVIQDVKRVRSHEVEQMQITDLLVGALSYLHRGLKDSAAKLELIDRIRRRSRYSLLKNTLYAESKFNLLVWQAS
ncbi:DUF3800 domain-containing protein [Dokdonella fugitiva]|jgi:hypothetical protein|uniref:DUF3800 domain-containing protein n=1 Tax=Dokdonella fugitiva TaxID=328517 RepID=UPI0015FC34B4|nr:DUF3800 domain-containing protein [Dokdonella fugitiva]MBA8883017.1 hypothetical protein [Dokdonella fugitiva]